MMRACLVGMMILLSACNGDNSSDGGVDGSADGNQAPQVCAGDFDCPSSGQKCWFVTDGGCSVANQNGVCLTFTPPDNCAANPTVACGCDGTTISVCAPPGYVDRPSNSAGACPSDGGSTDAGTSDAAGVDASDAGTD